MSKYQIIEKMGKRQKEGITLSTSSIDTMEKCHKQYYLQYIAKIKVPDDQTALVFGRMNHIIIENYHGGGGEEIKGLFKLFQDDVKLKEKYWNALTPEYKDKIKKAMFNTHYYLTNRYVKSVGIKHEEQFDIYDIDNVDGKNIHVQGKIDGIYEIENKLFITDFKTGKKKKDHSKQLGFYLYVINKTSQDKKITEATGEIVNLCLDKQTGFDDVLEYYKLEEFDILRAEKRIKHAISTLKENGIQLEDSEKWVKKPQKLCGWCKYYKSGHCNGK